jgi:hypothetical protein
MRRLALAMVVLSASAGAGADEAAAVGGCVERIADGVPRPLMTEVFPERGTSGYATVLEVTVEHGKGEQVLPAGLELQSASEAAKALRAAGFVIPDQDGGGRAQVVVEHKSDKAITRLRLPLVPLPESPGRNRLVLPSVPVSVARANGEVLTLCTKPHTVVVEDPTSSTPDAEPRPNPQPLAQREEWEALERALGWGAAGAALGALLAYLLYRYIKRAKPVPPPPPPRPAWEVALEALDEVRHAGLLEAGRFAEYFDRVSDAVRRYLGVRYGFDGLESTSAEILRAMDRVPHFGLALPEIRLFLEECDLVKFANVTPSPESCSATLEQAERVVRVTMPPEPHR